MVLRKASSEEVSRSGSVSTTSCVAAAHAEAAVTTTVTATGLPTDGSPVFVRLYFGPSAGPDDYADSAYNNRCDADERVQDNVCVPCGPGTTNLAADDVSGPDTYCDVTYCLENERVENNECVPCGPGETNEAGDGAPWADTECDGTP